MQREIIDATEEKTRKYKDRTPIASRSVKGMKLAMQLVTKRAIGVMWSKELEKLVAMANLAYGDEFFA